VRAILLKFIIGKNSVLHILVAMFGAAETRASVARDRPAT
jgi:hypothetical protein